MVVKTKYISHLLKKSGFITGCEREIIDITDNCYEFLPRVEAEKNIGYKQIIPYTVICRSDEVFVTRRLKKSGESRLHGLLSIGVGGHINPEDDGGGKEALMKCLLRELTEEVETENIGEITMPGLINDDSTGVGSVHLGFLYILKTTGNVRVKETEKLSGGWVKRSRLPSLSEKMETWAQIAVRALFM